MVTSKEGKGRDTKIGRWCIVTLMKRWRRTRETLGLVEPGKGVVGRR